MTYNPSGNISAVAASFSALMFVGMPNSNAEDLSSFAILAGSTITNTGTTVINGNIGLSPGTALTGFPPGVVVAPYAIHLNDGVAVQAQVDLVSAYNNLAARPTTINLTGQDLAGKILAPGVYSYNTSAQLTGTLTLDAKNNPNAVFIINVGSTLTTGSGSSVALVNGAQASNVYFVVGSSATLGTSTSFAGEILALTSITLNTGANILCGAALARNGAVTLDTNTISVCKVEKATFGDVVTTPVPTTPGTPTTGGTPGTPVAGGNQLAVAEGLDAYIAAGGSVPLVLNLLAPDQLRNAFSELAGETSTAVAPAGMQATNSFMTEIFSRMSDNHGAFGNNGGTPLNDRNGNGPATVKVLGYAETDTQAQQANAAVSAVERSPATPIVDPRLLTVWVAGYGDESNTQGDVAEATHDRNVKTAGFSGGLDYLVTPSTRIGFAVGAGVSSFDLADNLGSGDSNILQAAVHGRTEFGPAYVAAALATAWNDVSTQRNLTAIGVDRFTADFSAYDVTGKIETGYAFDMPNAGGVPGSSWITPYAAIQVQSFFTPAYDESSYLGTSPFALHYDSNTTMDTQTELGARIGTRIVIDEASVLSLRTRFAWAHNEGGNPIIDASFLQLPGSGFTVSGAQLVSDSLLASAGAEMSFAGGLSAGVYFDSQLAETAQTYAGTGRVNYTW